MSDTNWWLRSTRPGLLRRLSGGRPGRAALVLVGCHLALVAAVTTVWFVGLAPFFDGFRWLPSLVASAIFLVGVAWLLTAFGFWGVGVNSGQDGGDQFSGFSLPAEVGLGWLRWAVQILAIGGAFIPLVYLWMDMRWWHLFSTPEIDRLPATAATIPVPPDWTLDDVTVGDRPMGPPQGSYRQDFDAPDGFDAADFERWFRSAEWDDTFGPRQAVECDDDATSCEAELAPTGDGPPTYFVEASWRRSSFEELPPSVSVKLFYRSPGASEDPVYGLGPAAR